MANSSQVISNLDQTIGSFKSKVDIKINNVNTSTDNIKATTDKIYDNINRFKTDMLHNEEKQIAHENILRIDQIIKEQFSNHITIRRTVIGVVRDFDINLVRNSTIQELSEELWITSSRYWLSYALIAITAWVNDYPEVAKNALAECGRKDRIKATLFFCLMNLRFNRIEVAKHWFYEYLRTLDPNILQQETAILLQSFLNGIFGKDKELEHEVIKLIDEWITVINENAAVSEELINSYLNYISNLHSQAKFEYQAIQDFCQNSAEIKTSFFEVSKYDLLMDFVKSLDVEAEAQNDENYKSRIDAILTKLISDYDEEELELKNQQEYYRFIVENNGVVEQAEAQFADMQRLQNESFNIGKQMLRWAIYDDNEQTDVHVRRFAFQNTKSWFNSAVNKWSSWMQEMYPIEYKLNIDTWSGSSNGQDQSEQAESLKQHFNNNKFQIIYINNINIITAIVILASIALAFVTPFSLIVTVLAAAFLAYRILKANKEFPIRLNAAVENLNRCMSEISDFRYYFEENKNKKDSLLSMVEFL